MKELTKYFILISILLFLSPVISYPQVRVTEKPVPPRQYLKIPPKTKEGSVLLPGRWVWHRVTKMYIWLGPVWVEPPAGKIYSPGYWKTVRKGWVWIPGKWENKKHFWEKITG